MKKKIKTAISNRLKAIYKISIAVACIGVIVYFMPRNSVFNYTYNINTPWTYSQIMADFDFPIYKDELRLKAEKDSITAHFEPYFTKDINVEKASLSAFEKRYISDYHKYISREQYNALYNKLQKIYSQGIISAEDMNIGKQGESTFIKLINNNISSTANINNFIKIPEAYKILVRNDTTPHRTLNRLNLEEYIGANIKYDSLRSKRALNEELEALSISDGLVQKGQRIIGRGEIIDSRTYQILQSYHYELEKRLDKNRQNTLTLLGQIGFIFTCILLLLLFIYNNKKLNNNKILLTLLSATIFPVIVGLMMQHRIGNVFILPFAMVPMLLCMFVDTRTAFWTHVISILMCSIMLNSPYEFLLLQILAGCTAIFNMRELSSRSQMFRSVFFILITYAFSYLCYELVVENSIAKIDLKMYIYFIINAILLLFAYPMMFVIEKLFGFVSSVTLIELSNINSELLRKLSQDAPGTFQHSMQVGNLAAEAARAIGASSLEVRTGALYHDIGKTLNPIYFTENQSGGINPHNNLSPQESAKIIIKHVTDGLALADKHHLPKSIKEFISTHHGLGKTGYFYITYKNEHSDEDIDEKLFTYPGPNPTTREQAILMLADCVEAASHSIKEYTEENIDKLVNQIVDPKIVDGSLNLAPLTFQDISTIKTIFKERLKAIYHTRISYPSEKK